MTEISTLWTPGMPRLFGHRRFLVIFSRQGYMDPGPLKVDTAGLAPTATAIARVLAVGSSDSCLLTG
jgi:hypothetical protein